MTSKRTSEIRDFLITQVSAGNLDLVRPAQEKFGISRQAVNRHLRLLVAKGILTAEGNTRQRLYKLAKVKSNQFQFSISPDLHEDELWRNNVRPLLDNVPDNVLRICNYGVTEMLNNVVDHSEGTQASVKVIQTVATIDLTVEDNGIGILRKLKRDSNLEDDRYALLELA